MRRSCAEEGFSPLTLAVSEGSPEAVRALVGLGADVNIPDNSGKTPLLIAILLGNSGAVALMIKTLVELGAEPDNPNDMDTYGCSPVHIIAAEKGLVESIRALAEMGADLDKPNVGVRTPVYMRADVYKPMEIGGCTPCSVAAQEGHADAIRVLAELGADLDKPNYGGHTPVSIAAFNNHVTVVRALAELGADLDEPDVAGATPVSIAAEEGHV
jgi:ankyrin repeat protein